VPVHQQRIYADVAGSFPGAERASREVLSLPVHPGLSQEDRETIVAAVNTFGGRV
jgi:dTDP-4-amino-4,6-dideoxygalactose transaminase